MFLTFKLLLETEAAESFFIEALFKATEQIKCFWVVNQSTRLHL